MLVGKQTQKGKPTMVDETDVQQIPIKITHEEWRDLSLGLETHHALFYKMWEMGKPVFDETTPTAHVSFDSTGDFVTFAFNPKFWQKLDSYNKQFVIAHESLHLILNHGVRCRNTPDREASNVALDIVVNSSLVRDFGFDRRKIHNEENLCWIDTVFKSKNPKPADDECYEYYLNLFEKVYLGKGGKGEEGSKCGSQTVDDHSKLGGQEDIDKLIGKLDKELSPEEKESIKNLIEKFAEEEKDKQAGISTGGQWHFVGVNQVKKKKKWETTIKKWSSKYLKETTHDQEQWARLNRRMVCLPQDMFLPSEMEIDEIEEEKTKIDVFFYLDTSGSCWGLKDRFFTAALSLPEHRFNIRLFCFDTMVQETTLESRRIYGGGGTSFGIIEQHIQRELTNNLIKKYPEAVFLITDGYGDRVVPEKPKQWYWFISGGKHGIKFTKQNMAPPECNFFDLGDFE